MEKPYWKKSMELDDGFILSLWGINSTIISNSDDHKEKDVERKMRISRMQIPKREANTVYMTLCHHPTECWNDPDNELAHIINKRSVIQLYGHKHLQTIEKKDNTIIIGSGAAHPSRREPDWIPRYNWITINLVNDNSIRYLEVKIYPRIWNDDKFICDDSNCVEEAGKKMNYSYYKLAISDSVSYTNNTLTHVQSDIVDEPSWKRPFVYSFINLPTVTRQSILEMFELFSLEDDEGKKHSEMLLDIISRAETKQCVQALIETVNNIKGGSKYE